jgi:hypothetical protein
LNNFLNILDTSLSSDDKLKFLEHIVSEKFNNVSLSYIDFDDYILTLADFLSIDDIDSLFDSLFSSFVDNSVFFEKKLSDFGIKLNNSSNQLIIPRSLSQVELSQLPDSDLETHLINSLTSFNSLFDSSKLDVLKRAIQKIEASTSRNKIILDFNVKNIFVYKIVDIDNSINIFTDILPFSISISSITTDYFDSNKNLFYSFDLSDPIDILTESDFLYYLPFFLDFINTKFNLYNVDILSPFSISSFESPFNISFTNRNYAIIEKYKNLNQFTLVTLHYSSIEFLHYDNEIVSIEFDDSVSLIELFKRTNVLSFHSFLEKLFDNKNFNSWKKSVVKKYKKKNFFSSNIILINDTFSILN